MLFTMFIMTRRILLIFVFLSLAGLVQAKGLTKIQRVQHASPMPNLAMLIKINANNLALDEQQLGVVKDWAKNNKERSQAFVNDIFKTEKMIKVKVLEGVEELEFKRLKEKLLKLRSEFIDLKYHCNTLMKKTLSTEQWSQLMQIKKKKLAIVASDKEASNEVQAFLRVSPMPKLMLMIIMHEKELSLSKKQKSAFELWRLKNMNHWSELFSDVLKNEKIITQQALIMEPNDILMKQFDEMTKKRREMAQMSLNCRNNMQKILSEKQWITLLKLLKSYI